MNTTVTFDSNTWRKVVTPGYSQDSTTATFAALNKLAKEGRFAGYLPETIFNLETIPTDKRAEYFGTYRPNITSTVVSETEGATHVRVCIGPNTTNHPGNSHYHEKHLQDALALGFRLLSCPRIGLTRSPDINRSMFRVENPTELQHRLDKFMAVGRDIESMNAGFAQIAELGKKYRKGAETWFDALLRVPKTEQHLVKKCVAEWADGDAVAAHIAYECAFLCTNDIGKAAGAGSVFSPAIRSILSSRYGVRFVTPAELLNEMVVA